MFSYIEQLTLFNQFSQSNLNLTQTLGTLGLASSTTSPIPTTLNPLQLASATNVPKPNFYKPGFDGQPIFYADFDFNLTTHPVTKDIVIRTNQRAINQSLKNLLLTAAGEVLMNNDLGGNVRRMLGELNNPVLAFNIKSAFKEIITNHEPRIELSDVNVSLSSDYHTVIIDVVYFFANQPTPIRERMSLDRIR